MTLRLLRSRFGNLAREDGEDLYALRSLEGLVDLAEAAATCTDLEAFRSTLQTAAACAAPAPPVRNRVPAESEAAGMCFLDGQMKGRDETAPLCRRVLGSVLRGRFGAAIPPRTEARLQAVDSVLLCEHLVDRALEQPWATFGPELEFRLCQSEAPEPGASRAT